MIRIVNLETGEVIEREFNAEELAQRKVYEAEELARKAEAQAKAQAKAAAEAKLASLGLTTEDLKALGLGGN